jgi:DNA polymerase sigma
MNYVIFFLKKIKINHKLVYSKTMKSDIIVAILAVIVSLFVGYISLNSVAGSSVDLYDLNILIFYFIQIILFFYFLIK